MKKHRKRWTVAEKLEIVNYAKVHGNTKASREFNVSVGSVYNWVELHESQGEAGLSTRKKETDNSAELRRLKRENDELKKLVAEKELRLRILSEVIKKSH